MPTIWRMRALIPALVAFTALSPAVADAAKRPKSPVQVERFSVSLKGGQHTDWSVLNDDQAENCRTRTQGSGAENLVFASRKAQTVTLYKTRGALVFGNTSFATKGSITRDGYLQVQVDDPCEGVGFGDGEGPPPGPDCGRRDITYGVELDFKKDTVGLQVDRARTTPDSPFENCPIDAIYDYPSFQLAPRTGSLRAQLPLKKYLLKTSDKKKRTVRAVGSSKFNDPTVGRFSQTATSWEVTFKRKG